MTSFTNRIELTSKTRTKPKINGCCGIMMFARNLLIQMDLFCYQM